MVVVFLLRTTLLGLQWSGTAGYVKGKVVEGRALLVPQLLLKASSVFRRCLLSTASSSVRGAIVNVPGIGGGGGNAAILGGRGDAAFAVFVEYQHGWAALEAWVASLAGPVAVAGFAQGHVAVWIVLAEGCKL